MRLLKFLLLFFVKIKTMFIVEKNNDVPENHMEMKNKIKKIIKEEFNILIGKIKEDFKKNYNKKHHNFLLNSLDKNILSNIVFVSSFESKIGNAIQNIAREVAILRYGVRAVPNEIHAKNCKLINFNNYKSILNKHILKLENYISNFKTEKQPLKTYIEALEKYTNTLNGQIIVTDINIEDSKLKGQVTAFMQSNIKTKGNPSSLDQKKLKNFLKQNNFQTFSLQRPQMTASNDNKIGNSKKEQREEIKKSEQFLKGLKETVAFKPVDLAFKDENNIWNIFEIKAGGDLDSSNAKGNIEKLLSIYIGLNDENTKPYFATIYNKNGEGKEWTGSVSKYLKYPDMFLIGSEFWKKILPNEINFECFIEIYSECMKEIKLNKKLKALIKTA